MNKKYIKYVTKYVELKYVELKYIGGMKIDEKIDENYTILENYLKPKNITIDKYNYLLSDLARIKLKLNNQESNIIELLKTPEIIMEILISYENIQNKEIYDIIIDKFVNIENISIDYIYIPIKTNLFKLLLHNNLYDQINKYDLLIFFRDEIQILNFYTIIFYPEYINNFIEFIKFDLLPFEFIIDSHKIIYKILNNNLDKKIYEHMKYIYNFNIIHLYNNENIIKYFFKKFTELENNKEYINLILINILLYNETFDLFNKLIDEYKIDVNNIQTKESTLIQIIFMINNPVIFEHLKLIGLKDININILNLFHKSLIKYIDIHEPIEIIEYFEEITCTVKKFNIYPILELDRNIYHGSYYKIDNYKLNVPTFYSLDILQSLGHILILVQSYFHFYKNGKHINALQNKKHNINKPLSYYPIIYIYNIKEPINLLLLDDVWNNDFSYIYIPKILYKYLIIHPDVVNIIYKFCSQIMNIEMNPFISKIFNKLKIIIEYKDTINDIKIDYIAKYYLNQNLLNILEIYAKKCSKQCFRSFFNICGYELLTKIDYNEYFNEIGIKDSENIIDGLYVPNDQDEIILLNNNKLIIKDLLYIVPYSYLEQDDTNIHEYIREYFRLKSELNQNITNIDIKYFFNFYTHFLELGKSLNDSNTLTLLNSWFFDYYSTYCNNFNPYTHEVNGDCNERCKMLIPTDHFVYKDLTQRELKWSFPGCGVIKSQKVSIFDTNKLPQLQKYIDFLLSRALSSQLFGNIDYLE